MEEQNLNKNISSGAPKSRYWKFAIGFLVIMLLVVGGYVAWDKYLSPQARLNRQTQENYQKYLNWQKNYEDAMKNDTYGGKTPEETLAMFIDALKKGDVDLASKYFILEDNTNDPNYLTRKKWENALISTQNNGGLPKIIDIVSRAILDKETTASQNTAWFVVYQKNNPTELEADINLHLNTYSQVWKIESM